MNAVDSKNTPLLSPVFDTAVPRELHILAQHQRYTLFCGPSRAFLTICSFNCDPSCSNRLSTMIVHCIRVLLASHFW